MDIVDTIAWILLISSGIVCVGGLSMAGRVGYKDGAPSRKKKVVEPLEPIHMLLFNDVEELAKATPEYKAWEKKHVAKYSAIVRERNQWGTDYLALKKELKRKHCKHVYDHGSWRWWVCTECDYEQPWYYTIECDCEWNEDLSYYYQKKILIRRNVLCRVHGRDYEKYQEQRYEYYKKESLFAKGGIIKKETN